MKKPKVSPKKNLPADFSTVDVPPIDTATKNMSIPVLDEDASLKIEEADMMAEDLPQQEKTGKSLFALGTVIGLIVIAGTVALSLFYFKSSSTKAPVAVTEVSPSPTASPTPAPLVDINFEILNASGIAGQAGKTQLIVEKLGYKVTTVGNANSRETGMKLLLKSNLVDQKDTILSTLQKEFPKITYEGVFDSETVTARIIVGL
jgi:hypothetical protein